MNEIKLDGICKVVKGADLYTETQNGWKVVGTYQDSVTEPVWEMKPSPNGSSYHSAQPGPYPPPGGFVNVQKTKPSLVTFFVLVRNEESVISSLKEQIQKAESKHTAEYVAHEVTKSLLKDAENNLKNKEISVKNVTDMLNGIRTERDQLRTTGRKLETDIAKIRTAIGERQFKEILTSS